MFIPHTPSETREMLDAVGIPSVEHLFKDVPAKFRFPKLDLPPAMTEMEILAELQNLASANNSTEEMITFLGAGAYRHYIPAAVDMLFASG